MEELIYRKMRCNAGHETRPFAVGEILPRYCPVCNQPYDRRYNRPVLCREDGSVPGGELNISRPQETGSSVPDITSSAGTDNAADTVVIKRPQTDRRSETGMPEMRSPQIPAVERAVRRQGRPSSIGQTASVAARGPRGGSNVSSQSGLLSRTERGYASTQQEPVSEIALYNGGDCIEIPTGGGILGRESIGKEILGINPLVSRKHAYIKIRNGIVQIRDEGSLNGTFVDDGSGRRRLIPHETVELKKGDRIWLANSVFAIEEKR